MDEAMPYLRQRIANSRPGEKQAIVLDIDNTALETDFGFSFPQPANKPVLKAAQYAQENGVSLFFVTARPGILKDVTRFNLTHEGYRVDGLHVRGLLDLFKDVADYKTAQRAAIERQGLHDHREHRQQPVRPVRRARREDLQAAGLRRPVVLTGPARRTPGAAHEAHKGAAPGLEVPGQPLCRSCAVQDGRGGLTRPCSGSARLRRPPARSAGRPAAPTSPRRGR